MSTCSQIQDAFSHYLDGDVPGTEMLEMTRHLRECTTCAGEFAAWQQSHSLVSGLGPSKAPEDLALRLRVAISQESRRTPRERLGRFHIRWENTFQPFLLRASAGLASAILLVGTTAMLVSTFAVPQPVEARDVPLQISSAPHLLYSSFQAEDTLGRHDDPLVLQVFVDGHGRVYDYRVLAGQIDTQSRIALDNVLLFSVFEPARYYDQPVRGSVVMSFSGVSVRG
jgi:hypothetical protein